MAKNNRWAKKGSSEIHFRRSLWRFSLAFIVVLSSGLVTRYLVSQVPLEEKILTSFEVPDQWHFTLNKPSIQFSSGWLPVLGVKVQGLELQEKECPANRILVQDGLVVVNPFSLLAGQVEPYLVELELVEVSRVQDCRKKNPDTSASSTSRSKVKKSPPFSEAKNIKSLKDSMLDQFYSEAWPKIKKFPVKKVKINLFKVHLIKSLDEQIRFEGSANIKLNQKIRLRANLKKFFYRQKQLDFLSNQMDLEIHDNSMDIDWKAAIREGAIGLKFIIQNSKQFPVSMDLQVNKLPVSAVTDLLDQKVNINYLWGSCHLKGQGLWEKLTETKIEFSNCQLDGPYGSIVAHEVEGTFGGIEKVRIEVSKLDLDKIIKNRRGLYLSGVLEKYGVLSAELDINKNSVNGRGYVEATEFIFSKNNFRDIQKVNKVPFQFGGSFDKWEARFMDMELDKGDFAGELLVKWNPGNKIQGRVAFHKLRFNPTIYKLMLQAEPADLRLYGKFDYNDDQLQDWSALLASPQVNAEGYQLKNLKVKGRNLKGKVSEVQVSVAEGQVNSGSGLVGWLSPTQLDRAMDPNSSIEFSELYTRLEISENRELEWKRGYARLANGWQLSSEGSRDFEKKVSAWLQWDRPDGKFMKWGFQGAFFDGIWRPLTPWVQNWLQNNSEFLKKHKSLDYTFNPEVSGLRERINDAGKKAIEKVKGVIKKARDKEAH